MSNTIRNTLLAWSTVILAAGAQAQTAIMPTSNPTATQTSAALTTESLQSIKSLLASGKLNEALQLAQQLGMDLKGFATLAAQNGLSVADITTAILTSGVAADVGLKALGEAFADNQAALESVLATALTLPSITLAPDALESSIEAGCRKDCLPANVVSSLIGSTSPGNIPATGSTTTNSSSSGSGSSGAKPISPAG